MTIRLAGALLPPRVLKRLVELEGFSVQAEDDYNWALAKDGIDDVVIVPKSGTFVARDVCNVVLSVAPNEPPRYLFIDRPAAG